MEKEYRNGVERGLLFCTELATIYTQGDQYIKVFDIFGSNKETELTVEEVWNLADSLQKELIKRGIIYLTGYSNVKLGMTKNTERSRQPTARPLTN